MAFWRKKHWDESFDESYADRTRERRIGTPTRVWPHVIGLVLVGVLFVGGVGAIGGQTMFEKVMTGLAQPCGLIWLGLIALVYFALLYRQTFPAVLGLVLLVVLTVAGNGFVANRLAAHLESPYANTDIMELEPFDTVFLMGGGTMTRTNGQPQLNANGDRIVVAARLYHAGKIQQIICTGSQVLRANENDLHPREEAARLLEQMNVPASAIQQMKGMNTTEEASNMRAWLEAHPDHGRVGVVSSAWHLPRVMRLVEQEGIQATPVPADYLSRYYAPSASLLIPSAGNLKITSLVFKEYLARFVSR